jgi:hypothetical protein
VSWGAPKVSEIPELSVPKELHLFGAMSLEIPLV